MITHDGKGRQFLALPWALAAIVAIHVILAISYANMTPYRTAGVLLGQRDLSTGGFAPVPDVGAPDERQHVNYVIHMLEGKGLPVMRPYLDENKQVRNPNLIEEYEAHQPPLYYWLAQGFCRLTGTTVDDLNDPSEGKRLRYLNALFGGLTVLGVFYLAAWGLARRGIALLAATIAALVPMNLALSGAISNDPLLFALCTWALALCALGMNEGWRRAIAPLGLLIGLGLLTKATAMLLLPVAALAMLINKDQRPSLVAGLSSLALSLLMAYPLWLRNKSLYGDALGLATFKEAFLDALPATAMIEAVGPATYWTEWVAWWTSRSFIGAFGYMDIFLNERGVPRGGSNLLYVAILSILGLLAMGFLLSLRRIDRDAKRLHTVNGAFLLLIMLLFVQYNLTYFQAQGRYLYPAVGPICVGFAVGASYWFKHRLKIVVIMIGTGLVLLNLYALSRLPAEFERRTHPTATNVLGTPAVPNIET